MPKSCANSLASRCSRLKRRHYKRRQLLSTVFRWITLCATEQKDNRKIAYMNTPTSAVTRLPESSVKKSVIRRPYISSENTPDTSLSLSVSGPPKFGYLASEGQIEIFYSRLRRREGSCCQPYLAYNFERKTSVIDLSQEIKKSIQSLH